MMYSLNATLPPANKWTGVVTTARITDATPANAYAHVCEKRAESSCPDDVEGFRCTDIARQLVEYNGDIRVR